MSVFGAYSNYYNLLYRDKDYAAEVEYLHGLIQTHCPTAHELLDLGCGTGRHDLLLARMGYSVTGVDRSEEMLSAARSLPASLTFHHGDIRTIRLGRNFDAVISLFHVMSYQTTNEDLAAAFATAKAHLGPGGIFIFDCWYGPAVLTDRPVPRVKRLSDDATVITRFAEPIMNPNENTVDVNYQVMVRQAMTGSVDELHETHRMRYLFAPEVEYFAVQAGFEMVTSCEWLTGRQPGFTTWNVCFICRQ